MTEKLRRAAALKFDPDKNNAPVVTAAGKGKLAEAIIQLAREHDVPLHENASLAQVLSEMSPGQKIPPDLYEPVAIILAYILKTDRAVDKIFSNNTGPNLP